MPVHVDADLRLEIGGIRAHLSSDGDDLVLTTDDPAALLQHVRVLRSAVGPIPGGLLEQIADTTTVRLVGPSGPVATASLAGGRISPRNIQVHRPADLLSAAAWRRAAVIGALLVLGAIVLRRLISQDRSSSKD